MDRKKLKDKFYLIVFMATVATLGWGVWNNYRPQVILASCADMADRYLIVQKRSSLFVDIQCERDKILQDCLRDAGL